MSPDRHLAEIVRMLRDGGVEALVMGGHAVRYYGVDRNTVDFDLVTSVVSADELRSKIASIGALAPCRSEPVWRAQDFARFEIGQLHDGRAEYLEFWLRNHLLAEFSQLKSRAEVGVYGGESVAFLSLNDLIRSKETERESDWADIARLEEIQDSRQLATYRQGKVQLTNLLCGVRSRRGMDALIAAGLLADRRAIHDAIASCVNSITFAFLFPFGAEDSSGAFIARRANPWSGVLMTVESGTQRHFAVVEIVRRAYKREAMEADRADKQSHLA